MIENVSACIIDVPNPKVRQKFDDLEKIKDPEVFTKVASFEYPFRFKTGFNKPAVTIEDKDKIFHAIALHYTFLTSLHEILINLARDSTFMACLIICANILSKLHVVPAYWKPT